LCVCYFYFYFYFYFFLCHNKNYYSFYYYLIPYSTFRKSIVFEIKWALPCLKKKKQKKKQKKKKKKKKKIEIKRVVYKNSNGLRRLPCFFIEKVTTPKSYSRFPKTNKKIYDEVILFPT